MLIPLFLNLNHRTTSFLEKLKRVDWVGSVLFVASMMSLLIPITWGGVMYPWDHWRTLVPLVLGVVGLAGFMLYEKFVAKEPLIRLGVFSSRTALVNYLGTVMHGMIVSLELNDSQWLVEGVTDYLFITALEFTILSPTILRSHQRSRSNHGRCSRLPRDIVRTHLHKLSLIKQN